MATLADFTKNIRPIAMSEPCRCAASKTRFVSEYEEDVLEWVKNHGGLEAVQAAYMKGMQMTVTDNERRKVANNLRELAGGYIRIGNLDKALGFSREDEDAVFVNRLADLIEPQPVSGETSDGYHTFNELYDHRAKLFSVIVRCFKDKAWKSKLHYDGTMYDGMFIVGIETPEGQATYHYNIDPYWDMFECKELEKAPEWDGHTPQEAIDRISHLRKDEPQSTTDVRDKQCRYFGNCFIDDVNSSDEDYIPCDGHFDFCLSYEPMPDAKSLQRLQTTLDGLADMNEKEGHKCALEMAVLERYVAREIRTALGVEHVC